MMQNRENRIREAMRVRDRNIERIVRSHEKRMNGIKRKSASLRLKVCLPLALLFGLIAWYGFSCSNWFAAWCYGASSLMFLMVPVLGAFFDRPLV